MDEKEKREEIRKIQVRQDLRSEFDSTIDQRVERYLEINHQEIIGNHHFAEASCECIKLYRDSFFMSVVMVSQAVNEGIVRFVAERNSITSYLNGEKSKTKSVPDMIDELEQKKVITNVCAEASRSICRSFRNNVHHMNPEIVENAPHFKMLAKRNIQDLAKIEKEIFDANFAPDGSLILGQPKYWDCNEDGNIAGYLRFTP